jgi:outer membrane protein OmpA-like peptidoglycan-associated protein
MKFKLALLATVAGLSVFSASQSSAHNQGWYVGLEAGGNWIGDNDVAFQNNLGTDYTGTVSFDTGWAALATVGYGFERNWRVEFEAGYRDNDADAFFLGKNNNNENAINIPAFARNGELTEWSFMANVIYDVPLTSKLDLNIGVGAGADLATFKDGFSVDDQDWNFAYQAIVGLSYAVSDRLDLTLAYRYLNVDSPNFADATARGVNSYAFDDVQKHTVTVGLRYDLYADETPLPPEPPVAPPTATPEPEQFVIFFGFNKCNITPEADSVLGEAASAAKSNGSASVVIVGHTDTVGSDEYNQKLSQCRANAAKSNLVSKGIADGSISTMGRGETELLVKTGDNVKEPQNRRATIDLNK